MHSYNLPIKFSIRSTAFYDQLQLKYLIVNPIKQFCQATDLPPKSVNVLCGLMIIDDVLQATTVSGILFVFQL